jgi:two-component system NarL family sensor kinase
VTTRKLVGPGPLPHPEGLFRFVPHTRATESEILTDESSAASEISPTFVSQLLDLHEYERKRIGQELHDSTGQLLVSLQLSVARLKAIDDRYDQNSVIDEIRETVSEIDHEIRALAFLQYPPELGGRSLCEAVRSLVNGFGNRTGIRASFKCVGDQTGLGGPVSLTLLRVAQEALVNVHRHSHASSAKVTLDRQVDRLLLTVSDDGIGIATDVDAGTGRGIGLKGMRHRVEMQGGRFNIRNLKHGTKISATMPLVA